MKVVRFEGGDSVAGPPEHVKTRQGTPQRTFVDVAGAERYLANAMELVDVDPRDAEGPPTMRGEQWEVKPAELGAAIIANQLQLKSSLP